MVNTSFVDRKAKKMNIQQLKSLAKLALSLSIIGSAAVFGYLTWLISTSFSILLADLLLVLLHRRCRYVSRLYHFLHLDHPRRTHRHCDIFGPFVALCIAPLFSHKLFDINVSSCVLVATMFYLHLLYYFGKPRDFRVLNVLFMLTVNIAYGEFGFGPNTCASVAFFTYIAIMLAGQAEAGADDDLQHLTLNQIMSNLIIGTFYNSNSDNCFVMVAWRPLH